MDREVFGLSGSGARRMRGPLVPRGSLVLMNTTSLPSTMTRFSYADDRFIICAGDLYSADEMGGSSTGFKFYSQQNGYHDYSLYGFSVAYENSGTGDYIGQVYGTSSYGSGTHGHQITISLLPQYRSLILAEVNSWLSVFPANSIVLSHTSEDWGLTRVSSDGRYLMSKSVIESGGGTITSYSVASAGSHNHASISHISGTGSTSTSQIAEWSGIHSHGASLSATWSLKAYSVAALTSSSEFDVQSGMIIFWRQIDDPPPGWKICDGTNGTPDMRNYFLKLCAAGEEGTTGGDNSIQLTGTLNTTNASHSHQGGSWSTWTWTNYTIHTGHDWSHDHAVDDILTDQLPPYYGLIPIIKA